MAVSVVMMGGEEADNQSSRSRMAVPIQCEMMNSFVCVAAFKVALGFGERLRELNSALDDFNCV